MTPLGKRLWKMLPINVWVDRDKLKVRFGSHGFQNAISDLSGSGCIELEFREKDERGLMYPTHKQFIRRKPATEIAEFYRDHLTNPKSPHYNQRIFWETVVRCPKIKQIKYENPLFYGGDGRKRKKNPNQIDGWDDDW